MRFPLLFLLILSVSCHAQEVETQLSNPAPRVGDEITIMLSLNKKNARVKGANDPLSKMLAEGGNTVASIEMKVSSQYVTKAGPLRLGPLRIPIDGTLYSTDTLTINVAPKLPEGIINGIWVRMIKFEGVNYIVFEQRQPGEFKEKTDDHGRTSRSMSGEGAEWSDIHIDKIERLGIEIDRKLTSTSVEFLKAGNALYRQVVYTYKPLPSFRGELILDNSFIWKPPAKCFIDIAR